MLPFKHAITLEKIPKIPVDKTYLNSDEGFENIVKKKENSGNWYFLLFSQSFPADSNANLAILTLSQTNPGFYVSASQVFRKHCG